MARTLAGQGRYVELRVPVKSLDWNRQFDAWINATERWEFKSMTGNAVRSIIEAIGEAARQAERIMIAIASPG